MGVEFRENNEHRNFQPVNMIDGGHFSIFFITGPVIGFIEGTRMFSQVGMLEYFYSDML